MVRDTRTEDKKAFANTPTDKSLCLAIDIQGQSVGPKTTAVLEGSGSPKRQRQEQ